MLPLLPRAAILKALVGPAYALRVGPAYALTSSCVPWPSWAIREPADINASTVWSRPVDLDGLWRSTVSMVSSADAGVGDVDEPPAAASGFSSVKQT